MGKGMKYRKKPIIIEAEIYRPGLEDGFVIRHDPTLFVEEGFVVARSMDAKGQPEYATPLYSVPSLLRVANEESEYLNDLVPFINTLEGRHYISPGDWVITSVKGERYPCKPDIFEATYESVSSKKVGK